MKTLSSVALIAGALFCATGALAETVVVAVDRMVDVVVGRVVERS